MLSNRPGDYSYYRQKIIQLFFCIWYPSQISVKMQIEYIKLLFLIKKKEKCFQIGSDNIDKK
jgi:hypothetical protein